MSKHEYLAPVTQVFTPPPRLDLISNNLWGIYGRKRAGEVEGLNLWGRFCRDVQYHNIACPPTLLSGLSGHAQILHSLVKEAIKPQWTPVHCHLSQKLRSVDADFSPSGRPSELQPCYQTIPPVFRQWDYLYPHSSTFSLSHVLSSAAA